MYYPCSENKGADQLRGYREADLRLCFRIGKNPVFSRCGSISYNISSHMFFSSRITCLSNVYPLIPHFYIAKLGYAVVYLFFLFLLQNIDCGYSSELPQPRVRKTRVLNHKTQPSGFLWVNPYTHWVAGSDQY